MCFTPFSKVLGFALLSLLLAGSCFAERPIRILYFQPPSKAPEKAFLHVGQEFLAEAELPRHNFTPNIEIPDGNLTLSFLPRAIEEGEKISAKAPSIRISEGWQKVLLLVFEDKENPVLPIGIKAINASNDVFGPGSLYMINFSGLRIGGTLGEHQLDLKPKSFEVVKDPIKENGFYAAKLFTVQKQGDKPKRFIRQMWSRDDTIRQVVFIFPKPPPVFASYYTAPIRDF